MPQQSQAMFEEYLANGSGPAVNGTEALNGQHSQSGTLKAKATKAHPATNAVPNGSSSVLTGEVHHALYSESVSAKIWGIALRELCKPDPPNMYPEYTLPGSREYVSSSLGFWTSGFFPGCLSLLHQRRQSWPSKTAHRPHHLRLNHALKWWTASLHANAGRTDTHDLGFMIQPWAQIGWQLDGDRQCLDTMIKAARSLASRFDPKVGCIRSWDGIADAAHSYLDPSKHFLVIIDNMMNLDLLYYVSSVTGDQTFADIATRHALRTREAHIREDDSTCHVVSFDPGTGDLQTRFTHQGYADESCWSRGQAWGIAGFAQAYRWTRDERMLDASRRLADYFIQRLSEDNVPCWDFDAPIAGPKDSSAALIAVYGMLLLHDADGSRAADQGVAGGYLAPALRILSAVVASCLSPPARFVTTTNGRQDVDLGEGLETIVMHATINNYEFASRKWADHGLVYADYYFLLIGNKLLEMNLA